MDERNEREGVEEEGADEREHNESVDQWANEDFKNEVTKKTEKQKK